jgi:MFS family permease
VNDNTSRPKLWTKEFIIVSFINFLITLVFYLLIVIIGVYAVNEFDATTSQVGLVTGIFIIGALLGRLFIGRFIESIGRKRTLYIGLVLFIFATLLYFINESISFLLITRFVHGLAVGIASTATGTIVAQIIPTKRKGEGIGYFSMSATLGTAIGPFIGLFLSQHASFATIFRLCFFIGVFSFITAFFVNVPPLKVTSNKDEIKGFKLSNFLEPKALPIGFITLAVAFCYSSVLSYINFYAIEINLVTAAGFFFLVYSIAILLSRPVTGRLMDLKGANLIMYPAIIILAAGMLFLSSASNSISLLVAAALIGLGFGNIQSCTQAIAVKLTPPHRMGLATSTFFIFLDAGLGFGPYLLGFIIPVTGFKTLYVIMGLTATATVFLYYFLHGKKESVERVPIHTPASF